MHVFIKMYQDYHLNILNADCLFICLISSLQRYKIILQHYNIAMLWFRSDKKNNLIN